MKTAKKFTVSANWKLFLDTVGVDSVAALKYAGLPEDLFIRDGATLTPEQYFRMWQGIDKAAGEKELPLLLSKHLSIEYFDVPMFASICSPNLNIALQRLAQYKPLIGPMFLDVDIAETNTRLVAKCYGYQETIPRSFCLSELVFLLSCRAWLHKKL